MSSSYLKEAGKLVPEVIRIFVAAIVVGSTLYLGNLLFAAPKIELGDYIQLLILTVIAVTVGVNFWIYKKNEEFHRSSAFLKNAIELINKARNVLTAKNNEVTNDRVNWVTAARLITRAQHIASLISVDAHRKIFEAEHDYQRHCFSDFLTNDGECLPAAFFTGADDISLSIGEAVLHPSQKKDGQRWIPSKIVAVVYRFFQYPDGYEDPLDSSQALSQKELNRLWLFGERGVCDYLTFRKNFIAIGEIIKSQNESGSYVDMNAKLIDEKMENLSGLEE